MGTATAFSPRKSAQAAGFVLRCFCTRTEEEHPSIRCKLFQPRPCTCGHPYSSHMGKCHGHGAEGKCDCRRYNQDSTTEFLLRAGITAQNWQFTPIPQLASLMRPDNPDPTTRVWACIIIHAMERRNRETRRNRARLAIKLTDEKTSRPLLPDDIMKELNALDPVARMDRWIVRKEIRELERRGVVRQAGKTRKKIALFVYMRPLAGREIGEDPEFGGLCRPPNPAISYDPHRLADELVLNIRSYVVKTIRKGLRGLLENTDLVVQPDHQIIIDEAADEIGLVVQRTHQRLGLVVCPEALYKEDSISSSKGKQAEQKPTAPSRLPAQKSPEAENTRKHPLEPVGIHFRTQIQPESLETVHQWLTRELVDLYEPAEFLQFVATECRQKPGKLGPGMLLNLERGWPAQFRTMVWGQASARRKAKARAAEEETEQDAQALETARKILADKTGWDQRDIDWAQETEARHAQLR